MKLSQPGIGIIWHRVALPTSGPALSQQMGALLRLPLQDMSTIYKGA